MVTMSKFLFYVDLNGKIIGFDSDKKIEEIGVNSLEIRVIKEDDYGKALKRYGELTVVQETLERLSTKKGGQDE